MRKQWLYGSLSIFLLIIFLPCCQQTSSPPTNWPTEGWPLSTPEDQGLDSAQLAAMFEEIAKDEYAIHNVTIIRNGVMVADAAVAPYQHNQRHIIYSCTKSVVSALIGIAIEQGYIASVDVPLLDIFPDYIPANLDADKQAITLEHILMMSTGFECHDSYLYNWAGLDAMWQSDDWIQFMLDLPMAEPPGTRFEYCNGASALLAAIIQQTTGQTALEYAQTNLFTPLGITDVEWKQNRQGITIGYSELYLRPHDMAKIGYLYLNHGRWDDQQIVPEDWVKISTRKHINATLQPGYGYQWWIADDYYMALGYSGQYIVVVPKHDLVVAFTSKLPDSEFYVPQNLLDDYIIPAVKADKPLPENAEAQMRLEASLQALTQQ